ncbi:MAG: hypothetical protein KDA45_10680 [Planctomycetales bacterium]|nr:hypothetical protein [Planctomycetales bacterium]
MQEILLDADLSTAQMCQRMVDAANEAGGADNITVVISRFIEREAMGGLVAEVELPVSASLNDTVDFVQTPWMEQVKTE